MKNTTLELSAASEFLANKIRIRAQHGSRIEIDKQGNVVFISSDGRQASGTLPAEIFAELMPEGA